MCNQVCISDSGNTQHKKTRIKVLSVNFISWKEKVKTASKRVYKSKVLLNIPLKDLNRGLTALVAQYVFAVEKPNRWKDLRCMDRTEHFEVISMWKVDAKVIFLKKDVLVIVVVIFRWNGWNNKSETYIEHMVWETNSAFLSISSISMNEQLALFLDFSQLNLSFHSSNHLTSFERFNKLYPAK